MITQHFGWRWVFLGMVPLALAVGVLAIRPMAAFGPIGEQRGPSRIPLAFGAAAGVGGVVIGLQFANPFVAVASTVAGAVAGHASSSTDCSRPACCVPGRGLPAVIACRILATATFLGVDSFVPLAADRIHGASPIIQGFVIVGAALCWTAGQWLMARNPQIRPSRAVLAGFACLLVGIVLVTPVLSSEWPLWATFVAWGVGGLGMGLLFNPTTVSAMSFAAPGQEGMVGGQVSLADAVGFSLMGGIGGAMVALADRTSMSLTTALGINFALAAVLACTGMLASRNVARAGDTATVGIPAAVASA